MQKKWQKKQKGKQKKAEQLNEAVSIAAASSGQKKQSNKASLSCGAVEPMERTRFFSIFRRVFIKAFSLSPDDVGWVSAALMFGTITRA